MEMQKDKVTDQSRISEVYVHHTTFKYAVRNLIQRTSKSKNKVQYLKKNDISMFK